MEFPTIDKFAKEVAEKALDEITYEGKTIRKWIETIAKQQSAWIPVSNPFNELPKDRKLYVTTKFGYVETLVWDMTEWDDADIARSTVAYMDYYEPEPYKPDVTPKGKWIVHPKGIYSHLVCNKCLSCAPYDCETNYCPNCGAEMSGGEEDEVDG